MQDILLLGDACPLRKSLDVVLVQTTVEGDPADAEKLGGFGAVAAGLFESGADPLGLVGGRRGGVTLELHDLLGRRVATLVDDRRVEPGTHTYNWTPRSGAVSSGTYMLRLRAGDATRTRRLAVVR